MAVEVAVTRRRFTRKEYYRMAEAGILGERVRLVAGAATLSPQAFPDVALSTAEIFA
jgi:hypothetical protein